MRSALGDARAIEVVALFEESVLSVHHLVDASAHHDFTVGPDARAAFITSSDVIPAGVFPLVRAAGGDHELLFTAAMSGDVTVGDALMTLEALVESGHARPSASVPSAFAWPLVDGARCKVEVGQNTFLVSTVASPHRLPLRIAIDWREQAYTAGVATATMLFLLMIFSMPPDPKTLSIDAFLRDERFARFVISPPDEKEQPPTKGLTAPAGAKGRKAAGPAGKMGSATAKSATGLVAIKGPKDNKDPAMAKALAEKAAKSAGIIGVMASLESSHIASMFGRDNALGSDATDVMGGLVGTEIGDAVGNGGLSIVGGGHGGGGDGEGTVGTGKLGTIGRAGGGGGGRYAGYGNCGASHGCAEMSRHAGAPTLVEHPVVIGDGLDKELIRRVVHRHLNEVKFCYEQQLAKKPDLDGRIGVQFTIAGTGAVLLSTLQSSTMHDPFVEQCVVGAVRRWEFPKPRGGGIVTVSYPFSFKAAGE